MAQIARKFSVHPKLAALIDLILNIATLVILPRLGSWQWFGIWFAARAGLWALFIRLVYYPPELSRWRHLWSLIFFNFGLIVALSIFVEWAVANYLLSAVFVIFSAASFWLLPTGESNLTFYQKPFRRWLFLMDAFGLAGLWSGIYAFMSFQIVGGQYFFLMYLAGAVVTTIVSLWWWQAYSLEITKKFFAAVLVCFALIFELAWIVGHWPLGFMMNGIVMVWFWYNIWLILRFNLSPEGVDWKKQKFFLVSNVILFVFFMLFAKWN